MTSPLRRAPSRSTHLHLVDHETSRNPRMHEGFSLTSHHTHKADAQIDYTRRRPIGHPGKRKILIVPGYGGIKPAYGKFRDAFEDDATSFRHPRTQEGLRKYHPERLLHPDRLGKQSVVGMIDELYDEADGQKLILVGHSMGGPNAIEGARRRKNKVGAVVLLGSGGLEAGQNVFRLAKRMPKIALQEGGSILSMPNEDVVSMFGQAAFHLARNPLRSFGEAMDIGNRDLMIDEITELRAADIGIHAVQLERDSFFPTEIAERDTKGLVDTFTVVEGVDHVAPQVHPELVAEHIVHVLENGRPSFEMIPIPLAATASF